MRIKKLFIKNFKNIREKSIIDFESSTTFLVGPNGFGKTTVFDALELTITGEIHRASEKDVTNDTKDYRKPFFQNDVTKDVIIKVWLENSKNEDLVIVKHYDVDSSKHQIQGRRYKPGDFTYLYTYKDTPENFENDNIDNLEKITSQEIVNFFDFSDKKSDVKTTYRLFNYLQQEEVTFFLKKSENDRKAQFTHLFQLEEEEKYLKKIEKYRRELGNTQKHFQEKIQSNRYKVDASPIEYESIFPNKDVDFDKEDPFIDFNIQDIETRKQYYDMEISRLINFKQNFDPEEYKKKRKLEKYKAIIEDRSFTSYVILKKYLEEENVYNKVRLQQEIIRTEDIIKYYLLQRHIGNFEKYQNHQKKYRELKVALTFLSSSLTFDDKLKENLLAVYEELDDRKVINNYFQEYEINLKLEETINKTLDSILNLRRNLKVKTEELLENSSQCPYCGQDYDHSEELNNHFLTRENELNELADDQTVRLNKIRTEIQDRYIRPALESLPNTLKEMESYDERLLEVLKQLNSKPIELEKYTKILSMYEERIIIDLTQINYIQLEQLINDIKLEMKESSLVSKEVFELLSSLSNQSFETHFKFIEQEFKDKVVELNKFSEIDNSQMNNSILNEQIRKLGNMLESWEVKFSHDKLSSADKFNNFSLYFNNDALKFKQVSEKELLKKKNYIEYRYSLITNHFYRENYIKNRKLLLMIEKIDEIIEVYRDSIKKFKSEMIDQIKIPFYIYTAKVLQNYQQGFGIFLSTKHGAGDSIRFITDNTSDHDAMHHLSSGQLSVIALAFTLAVNKSYKISDELNFLLIDDPIVDMDVMNIYATTELLRYEFLEDYQIILSTHNSMNANFMNFIFNKSPNNTINLINVQQDLFYRG
ncbi:AAA family ATPase [Aerococcus urinaeequi]|uniref:AAA family ATPase n=2 Tax=Aerococcus urinaeequi TaxID=51665 RepID=UPI003D6B4270